MRELGRQLSKDYCPAAQRVFPFRQSWCRDCLMPAISDCWKFKYERLCCERTFADALNGHKCSSAMKEILAVLHYAKTDPAVAALMPRLFLNLEGKQQLHQTPYWNRWVEDYKKGRKPQAQKFVVPEALEALVKNLSDEEWKMVKRIRKEGKK